MTTVVVLDLVEKFSLNLNKVMVNILKSSTTPILGGTSAELLEDDSMSV